MTVGSRGHLEASHLQDSGHVRDELLLVIHKKNSDFFVHGFAPLKSLLPFA
jgi:hypothetical protein